MTHFIRLSESPLWQAQRAYFEAQGPRAWASGAVPHYVTSNPYMARTFADVIAGFAADAADACAPADELRPLYVVELGAGCGRLGYQLARLLERSPELRRLGWRPVYVLTDLAESTIAWWRAHPWLAPLFAAGVLDVARFDVASDDTLALRVSGRTLTTADPAEALVVTANYLFDSVPQDVFAGGRGMLFECLVAARSTIVADPAGDGFRALDLSWRLAPIGPAPYGDPVRDAIVASYRDADGVVTFPSVALTALERLRALSRGPMLVLSADKGGARLDDVVTDEPPALVRHGSVSMTVNYQAFGEWALAHGGTWMHTAHRHRALEVCTFVLGCEHPAATAAAFERAVAQRGPDDFYGLKRFLVAHASEMSMSELLAYLRLSGYDAKLMLDCAHAFHAALADATDDDLEDLGLAIARVWEGYLPIGGGEDVAGVLDRLAQAMKRRPPAGLATDDPFAVFTATAPGMACGAMR